MQKNQNPFRQKKTKKNIEIYLTKEKLLIINKDFENDHELRKTQHASEQMEIKTSMLWPNLCVYTYACTSVKEIVTSTRQEALATAQI